MDPVTLAEFSALMRQAGQDGAATALAARPPAPAPAPTPAPLNPYAVGEINALFQQETFRTALAAEIAKATPAKVATLAQDDPATTPVETPMERGNPIASAINSMDTMAFGLPLGSALVGGFGGLLASKVIDRFVAPKNPDATTNFLNPLAKVGAAWASVSFLDKAVGQNAARFMAGLLLLDAARSVLPIDEWVAKLVNLIPGGAPAAQTRFGAQQRLAMYRQQQLNGYTQAPGFSGNLPSAPLGLATGGPNNTDYIFSPR
jgi:hypothetical protein